jgi:hypothetical protein
MAASPSERGGRADRRAGGRGVMGVIDEATQQVKVRAGCKTEGFANSQIGLEMPAEVDVAAHCVPPIQGNATPASASRSSLA